jgi:hypothetical protein
MVSAMGLATVTAVLAVAAAPIVKRYRLVPPELE